MKDDLVMKKLRKIRAQLIEDWGKDLDAWLPMLKITEKRFIGEKRKIPRLAKSKKKATG